MDAQIAELISLSHEIGREDRNLALLAEGNASMKLAGGQFAIKASGTVLGSLREEDVTLCESNPVLKMLEAKSLTDLAIEKALIEARVQGKGKKPSTEAVFHAWLLSLE